MTIRNIRQNINQNRGRMNVQLNRVNKHQKLTSTTANPNPKPEPKMRICMDESLDVKQIGISRILLDDLDSEGDLWVFTQTRTIKQEPQAVLSSQQGGEGAE
ncbi:hypothetical protein BY996DRAFT_6563842 [Phakopsora pachyrhizi]|nr:hypothetical protein BY996DRAFT_6563842 [Phakopsora pachyrhizi]